MFAVLESAALPSRRGRAGYRITVRERPCYISLSIDMPLGSNGRGLRRRVSRGLREAARMGSVGVVVSPDFPFPELPGQYGLAVSSAVPLLRRLAGQLCRFAVEESGIQWNRVRVSLIGSRATPEMAAAAQMLAHYAKTFGIEAGCDTDAFCYALRKQTGISVLPHSAGQAHGDILILFSDPGRQLMVGDRALVLNLSGGIPAISGGRVADGALLEPPRSMWRDWPDQCDNGAMLAALAASGQVGLSEIGIKGLTFAGQQ